MSDGLHALKGFDYQVTVTLDVLLQHFGGEELQQMRARPEGEDDLVLSDGQQHALSREYVQIKKPRENSAGELTNNPWSVADVVRVLLPGTMDHLRRTPPEMDPR